MCTGGIIRVRNPPDPPDQQPDPHSEVEFGLCGYRSGPDWCQIV